MTLKTDDQGEIPDVDAATLDGVLAADAFGTFAVLFVSETEFMQAGRDCGPNEQCQMFLQTHGSDPWLLEYREGDQHYGVAGWVSLARVREVFRAYLCSADGWRSVFEWVLI